MTTPGRILLYGANGTTGRICARMAKSRELDIVLGGRSASVEKLGAELDLPALRVALDDRSELDRALSEVDLVLHMAGPFSATSAPMLDACLRTGRHYLDITGEMAVFDACQARDDEATRAGIVVMPGVGFDVVPTDCLAAQLAARLPSATQLVLAFYTRGEMSRGTTKTAIEALPHGSAERIEGEVVRRPFGEQTREIPFPSGTRLAVGIPWGDISTAYWSTHIPNIRVYTSQPPGQIAWMRRMGRIAPVLGLGPVQAGLKAGVDRLVKGPSDKTFEHAFMDVWGEVQDDDGATVTGSLTTPEGYTFTADAALRAAGRVLDGVAAGYQTPSSGLGPDFVGDCDDVVVHGFSDDAAVSTPPEPTAEPS